MVQEEKQSILSVLQYLTDMVSRIEPDAETLFAEIPEIQEETRKRFDDGSMLPKTLASLLSRRYHREISIKTLRSVADKINAESYYAESCRNIRYTSEAVKKITDLLDCTYGV